MGFSGSSSKRHCGLTSTLASFASTRHSHTGITHQVSTLWNIANPSFVMPTRHNYQYSKHDANLDHTCPSLGHNPRYIMTCNCSLLPAFWTNFLLNHVAVRGINKADRTKPFFEFSLTRTREPKCAFIISQHSSFTTGSVCTISYRNLIPKGNHVLENGILLNSTILTSTVLTSTCLLASSVNCKFFSSSWTLLKYLALPR